MYADAVKQYAVEHGLTESEGVNFSADITNQLVGHLNDLGIETHGSKDMEEDLRRRGEEEQRDELSSTIDKARLGDEGAIEELQSYGIPIGNAGVYRFVSEEEANNIMNGGKYNGRFDNGMVDVTSSQSPTTAANASYRITFKSKYDLYKEDGRTRLKNEELGDGYIEGGYTLDDVAVIEKRNEDGSWEVVYENTESPSNSNVGTFSTENDDIRYFINQYSLPDGEFTKLESILLTQYGNNEDYGVVVHTVNYEYTVNYKGGGEFDIIEYHQIDNNIDNKVYDKERRSTGSYDRLSVRDELAEGECESGSYDVAESEADQYNAGLDTQAREGESEQTKSDAGSQKHQGWRAVKRDSATGRTTFVDESDFESTAEDWEREPDEFFKTSRGEVYGYATPEGTIYLDERVIKKSRTCVRDFFIKACPLGQPDCLL